MATFISRLTNNKFHCKSGLKCDHCGKDPGMTTNRVFLGFKDLDILMKVCFNCRDEHYRIKRKSVHANLYSEVPIVVPKLIPENNEINIF